MGVIEHWHGSPDRLPELVRTLETAILGLNSQRTLKAHQERQKAGRRALLEQQSGDRVLADLRLERILAGNDLTDISSLALGLQRARSVGRIIIRQDGRLAGYATGFLVAPGVLITNQHVFPDAARVRDSLLQMNYERTMHGEETDPISFSLQTTVPPIIDHSLDVAIVGVEPYSKDGHPLQPFGWLTLDPQPGKAFVGEYLTIIQHPGGERKQVCVRENKLLKYAEAEPFVWYQTDTVGGSSGSPVFNTTWDVVALHHQSVPRVTTRNGKQLPLTKDNRIWTPDMGDSAIDWLANEGVRISSILQFLQRKHAQHPLAQAILRRESPPTGEAFVASGTASDDRSGIRVTQRADGRTTIFVPVELDLRLNTERLTDRATPPHTASNAGSAAPSNPQVFAVGSDFDSRSDRYEAVSIDTTNYAKRNGYQPDFLGGSVKLPLPKVAGRKFGSPLVLQDRTTELKYWNYSVVMNRDRGLAFFSAANIRPAERLGQRDGNDFIRDSRVDAVDPAAQIDDKKFYKQQSTFESDNRARNPFDQGHLTRREDLQWGQTEAEAKRSGDDSFHYTNCAPQHYAFNQNRKVNGLWNRLETMAIDDLTDSQNLCIINGPVFNAPKSTISKGEIVALNLNGPRHADPVFGSVQIPKMFFKLIAWRQDTHVSYRAFVVSQEQLLESDQRIHEQEGAELTDEEVALYEVRVSALEKLTGLRFGLQKSTRAGGSNQESAEFQDDARRINDASDL